MEVQTKCALQAGAEEAHPLGCQEWKIKISSDGWLAIAASCHQQKIISKDFSDHTQKAKIPYTLLWSAFMYFQFTLFFWKPVIHEH